MDQCVAQCYNGASVMSDHLSGVQKRIKKLCARAIYIHCFAHRLNLVVVDVAGAIGCEGDMVAVLQRMHNFLSTSVVHVRFVAAQKTIYRSSRVWEIPSLSDTSWVCLHDAVLSVTRTFQSIVSAFDDFSDEAGIGGNNARALQFQVNSCFIVRIFNPGIPEL